MSQVMHVDGKMSERLSMFHLLWERGSSLRLEGPKPVISVLSSCLEPVTNGDNQTRC